MKKGCGKRTAGKTAVCKHISCFSTGSMRKERGAMPKKGKGVLDGHFLFAYEHEGGPQIHGFSSPIREGQEGWKGIGKQSVRE